MNYFTQMEAAKKGLITEEMKKVAIEEGVDINWLVEKISEGKIVIPANKNHKKLKAAGIGEGLRTKINVNLGTSGDYHNIEEEVKKVKEAIKLKADAVMDLSTYGNTGEFRRKIIEISPVMIGTVPVYDVVAKYCKDIKDIKDITVDEFFKVVEEHAKDGVDFLTIHAGLNKVAVDRIKRNKRLTNVVSRGGSILLEWMEKNDRENPFYEHFDRLLEICKKYDVTISLGDGLRPGSINDATDIPQVQELIFLGELTKVAWEENVQVMIEGPGHLPLDEIIANMKLEKKLCHGAPFYVLGPIVTDVAPGYDHITSAIGGAIAASYGADFLCYVTPAEHLRLPTLQDVKEGIIAVKIAARVADIVKGVRDAKEWDYEMSEARAKLDWEKMLKLAIDPEKAKKYRKDSQPKDERVCTMCGDLCVLKRSREVIGDIQRKNL
ncbi:MAG TPA: phosphomethylpyrimidine synthase ThiC [Candidatus Atribacteria bacterium]|nr:phosphomethylpyrimidine synthase ThiC [Candidatus Atribacteria bacterium]